MFMSPPCINPSKDGLWHEAHRVPCCDAPVHIHQELTANGFCQKHGERFVAEPCTVRWVKTGWFKGHWEYKQAGAKTA